MRKYRNFLLFLLQPGLLYPSAPPGASCPHSARLWEGPLSFAADGRARAGLRFQKTTSKMGCFAALHGGNPPHGGSTPPCRASNNAARRVGEFPPCNAAKQHNFFTGFLETQSGPCPAIRRKGQRAFPQAGQMRTGKRPCGCGGIQEAWLQSGRIFCTKKGTTRETASYSP